MICSVIIVIRGHPVHVLSMMHKYIMVTVGDAKNRQRTKIRGV